MPNWVIHVKANPNVCMEIGRQVIHHLKTVLLNIGDSLVQKLMKSRLGHHLRFAAGCNHAGKTGKDIIKLFWGKVFHIFFNERIYNSYLGHGGCFNLLGNGHTFLPDFHGGFINESTTQLAKGAMRGPTGSTGVNISVRAILWRKLWSLISSGCFRMATNKTCLSDSVRS